MIYLDILFKQYDRREDDVAKALKCNRLISDYAGLLYLTVFTRRDIFNNKNVMHIVEAVRNTEYMITNKLQEMLPSMNELEIEVFRQLRRLLTFCQSSNDKIPKMVNYSAIEQLFTRVPDNERMTNKLKGVRYILGVTCQEHYRGEFSLPSFRIPTYEGTSYVISQIYTSDIGQCEFSADNNEKYSMNYPMRAWYNVFTSCILPMSQGSVPGVVNLLRRVYVDVLPSITNGIGISRLTLEGIISRPASLGRRALSIYNYVDTRILDYLSVHNRVLPKLEELVNLSVPRQTLDPRQLGISLEADDDEVPDEGGDDAGDDAGDDTDEGGDEPTDDATDDPTDDATDDEGGDAAGDEGGSDNPKEGDNPEGGSGEDNTNDAPKLLKLNLELPKDETLDDLLYKVTVSRYIDELINTRTDIPTNSLKALRMWKNLFLFLVSAKETKKFLAKLKQKI